LGSADDGERQEHVSDLPRGHSGDAAPRRRIDHQQRVERRHSFHLSECRLRGIEGAVRQLTQNIGVQYAAKGIRCNVVLPGYIATPRITDRLQRSNPNDYDKKIQERRQQVPVGRLRTAWDVAYAVLYLACEESSFVTATEIVVDGGQTAAAAGKVWER
jgi:hypothetical protein